METLKHLFDRNEVWARKMKEADPDFFSKISKQQTPEYLWIGCSDSRVPADQVIDLLPGQLFVHRNVANIVVQTDLNCLSVIQYAVEVLKIKHIIVCGHYGCGGIKAAMENQEHGLIDNWLRNIKNVYRFHKTEIDSIQNKDDKFKRLCELNVVEQVSNICHTTIVQSAWNTGKEVTVHGWIYCLEAGLLTDLNTCISSGEEVRD
jgi:carbonic anhydrase